MKDLSQLTPDTLYTDDCLHIQFHCGCFVRAFVLGENEVGGEHMTYGWSLCEPHEKLYVNLDFNTILARRILEIDHITVITGIAKEITDDAISLTETATISGGTPGEDRGMGQVLGVGALDELQEAAGESEEA